MRREEAEEGGNREGQWARNVELVDNAIFYYTARMVTSTLSGSCVTSCAKSEGGLRGPSSCSTGFGSVS